MHARRLTVFLPCHTLDDLPSAPEPREAEDLLSAWTAAWHPAILAACETVPDWASVHAGLPDTVRLGIVPATWDDSFSALTAPEATARLIRGLESPAAITAELARRVGCQGDAGSLPGELHRDDFQALGLAALLAELLARRMRTDASLGTTGFTDLVLEAARAAVASETEAVRERLGEAFACLDASRARYYPVESWALDLVLLAGPASGGPLLAELDSPVPLAVVATGNTLRQLATTQPAALAALRAAVAAGRVEPCGGRDDDTPLDRLAPEAILASFTAGRAAWQDHVAAVPVCQAAMTGGSSAILPQVLRGLGYRSAIWSLCDGSPLPDPGGGRILWEGTGGGSVGTAARVPLDASYAGSVLAIPAVLADAMDRDHVAVLQFASYAGAASRWHRLLRRIGQWSGLLGRFVTPSAFVAETVDTAATASFEPDAFPSALPVDRVGIETAIAATTVEAEELFAAEQSWRPLLPAGPTQPAPRFATGRSRITRLATLLGRRRENDRFLLDNELVRIEVHPRTGGLLSLRRPEDRGNRLSQQLALRTTSPARPGVREAADDRALFTRMEADAIHREGDAAQGRLVSRGRLVTATGQVAGRYTQKLMLATGLPLAVLDIEVTIDRPLSGPPLEEHVACRFAWHENEAVEIRRSLHLQSVITERTRLAAPHFIEIVPERSSQAVAQPPSDAIVILTGGLPWHLLTSPHVLDSVLPASGVTVRHRLAVAAGLERPWEAAVAIAAGQIPQPGPQFPATVRLTGHAQGGDSGAARQRVGLVESVGRSGEVRIEWAHQVSRVTAIDVDGQPLPQVHVAVDGRSTVVFLQRYQWLHLELEFAAPVRKPVSGRENLA